MALPERPGPPRWCGALGLVALLWSAAAAGAHVAYVAPDDGTARDPISFAVQVLSQPINAALLLLGVVMLAVLVAVWERWGRDAPDARALADALDSYRPLVPWMLRLSVGLPLIGAAVAGFLFTPALGLSLRLPQVVVGFLLLLGLATRLAAVVGLAGWIAALAVHGQALLLAGEFVGGFLGILLLGPGRPSLDDLLERVARDPRTWYHRLDPVHRWARRLRHRLGPVQPVAPVLVRVPLGATFVYLGLVEKLAHPGPALALANQLGLPDLTPVGAGLWVLGAGLVEVGVGLLIVVGLYTRAASATAFLVLTLTLLALPNDPVLPHVTLFGLTSVVFTLGGGPWSLDAIRTR